MVSEVSTCNAMMASRHNNMSQKDECATINGRLLADRINYTHRAEITSGKGCA